MSRSRFTSILISPCGLVAIAIWTSLPTHAAARVIKPIPAVAQSEPRQLEKTSPRRLSLALRDTPIAEVFDMLARSEKANIVLGKGVKGTISVSLNEVTLDQAIRAAAEAGGFIAERRDNAWLVMERADLGKEEASTETGLATYRLLYAPAQKVAEILTKHLSRYGKVTPLIERKMVVVEDRPETLVKLAKLVRTLDVEPRQILLEAQILEIKLDKSESFGIDWRRVFSISGGKYTGSYGNSGLVSTYTAATPLGNTAALEQTSAVNDALGVLTGKSSPEFFATIAGSRFTAYLSALAKDGRVQTLSTPRLLVMEGEKALTQIGQETGFRKVVYEGLRVVETVEFIPSGVILRVTPTVDANNRVLMTLYPEVSSVSIVNGLPNKETTTVQTTVIANDGETVFIGGLIKGSVGRSRQGIPVLNDVPVVGGLFGLRTSEDYAYETVILITPRLIVPGEGGGVEFSPSTATREFIDEKGSKGSQFKPRDLTPIPPQEPPAQGN